MIDLFTDPETAELDAWADLQAFDPDRSERLEALATGGRGPARLAAATLVAVDARLGRWRRGSDVVPAAVPAAEPSEAPAVRMESPAAPAPNRRHGAPRPLVAAGRGPDRPLSAGAAPGRRPRRPAPISPAEGRSDVATSPDETPSAPAAPIGDLRESPAPPAPTTTAVKRRRAAAAPAKAALTPTAPAPGPHTPETAPEAAPLPAAAHRGAGRRRAPLRAARAVRGVPAFPAELAELADRHGVGVGEEDAWDRWVSSADTEDLEARTADLDRAPGRAERAEDRLAAVGRLASAGPRRLLGASAAMGRRPRTAGLAN